MSVTYWILSPLSEKEMLDLEYECGDALDAWFEAHPDTDEEYGEMETAESVPTLDEVEKAYKKRKLKLDDATIERLSSCESAFTIEEPASIELGGLQLSILRYLLQRAGSGLVSLGDYPFETCEAALARLEDLPGVDGFADGGASVKRSRFSRAGGDDGKARAERVLRILESAMRNVNQAIDVKNALYRASEASRNYGALLLEEGAMTDVLAAERLGVELDELVSAADSLDQGLKRR
ncbi:MAG: hypothetical protein R3B13_00595 [Polyangiaceae bacterium]